MQGFVNHCTELRFSEKDRKMLEASEPHHTLRFSKHHRGYIAERDHRERGEAGRPVRQLMRDGGGWNPC